MAHLRHFPRGWTFLADEHYLIVVRYQKTWRNWNSIVCSTSQLCAKEARCVGIRMNLKSLVYHQKESCALHVYRRPSCLYYCMTVCVDMDTYYITTKRSLVTSHIPCVTTYTTKYALFTQEHTQLHTQSLSRRANELCFGIYTLVTK